MKIYFTLFICLMITVQLFAQDSLEIDMTTGDLIVIVKNLENNEGMARIALTNSLENYNRRKNPFKGISSEIDSNNTVKVIFEDIPFGEYSLKMYHDENNNNEMDTNFLGIPSENYGFSNNSSGSFGPPDWEDAKFLFESDNQIHEIDIGL